MSATSQPDAARRWCSSPRCRAPLIIFAAALALRLLYVLNVHEGLVFPDEQCYWRVAQNFLDGRGLVLDQSLQVVRAPIYPLVLAGFQHLFRDNLLPLRVAQAVVSALTCVLIFALGRAFAGQVCGAAAGAVAAVYPFFVFYTSVALSETLFMFELVLWMLCLWRLLEQPRWVWAAAAGAAIGVCALTRPSALLLAPAAVPLFVIRSGDPRRAWARMFLMLAACAAVMAPWVWRNYRLTGHFVPTTLQVGASLYESNAPDADGGPAMDRIHWPEEIKTMSEYERNRYLLRCAWKAIRSDWSRFGRLTLHRAKRFWNLAPNYREYRGLHYRILSAVFVGPVLLLGLIGLALSWRRPRAALLLLLPVAYFAALHSVFVGSTRYRTPIMPFVMVFMGRAVAADLDARRRKGKLRLRADVAAAWAALLLIAGLALAYAWHVAIERGKLQRLVNESIGKCFGGPASAETVSINPWSGILCRGVALQFQPPGALPAAVRIRRVALKQRWLPLVNKRVAVEMARLEGVDITVPLRPHSHVYLPAVIKTLAELLAASGSPTVSAQGVMRIVQVSRKGVRKTLAELADWKVSIFPVKGERSLYHLQSSWTDARLGRVQLQGKLDAAGPDLHLEIVRQGLRLGPKLMHRLPAAAQSVWRRAGLESGRADLRFRVDFDHAKDKDLRTQIICDVSDVAFTYSGFPYPVLGARGHIEWKDRSLRLVGVRGFAGEAPVRLRDAQIQLPPPDGAMLTLEASGLQIDRVLRRALPAGYQRIWDEFEPRGVADVVVDMAWRGGRAAPAVEKVAARFRRGSIAYIHFRLPISRMTGEMDFLPDRVNLRGLRGEFDGGRLALKKAVIFYDSTTQFSLPITFRRIPLNKRFYGILSRDLQAIWSEFHPEGFITGSYELSRRAGRGSAMTHSIRLKPDDSVVRPACFPAALTHVSGAITSTAGPAGRLRLQARLDGSPVFVSGTFGPKKRRLRVRAADVKLTKELFRAAPLGVRRWAARVRPSGAVDVDAVLETQPGQPGVQVDGLLRMKGCATRTKVRVADVDGELTFRGRLADQAHRRLKGVLRVRRARIGERWLKNLAARYSEGDGVIDIELAQADLMGGAVTGALHVVEDSPRTSIGYQGKLSVEGIRIEKWLTPEQKRRRRIKHLAGHLAASAEFEGAEKRGDAFRASGAVVLSDGQLGELPLFLGVLNLMKLASPKAAAFTDAKLVYRVRGRRAYFTKADLIGPTLSLYGRGQFDQRTGKLNFKFLPELGKNDKVPVASSVINAAKRMLFPVELKGTYDDPAWVIVPLLPVARAIGGLVGAPNELEAPSRR